MVQPLYQRATQAHSAIRALNRFGPRIFLVEDGKRLTYAETADLVARTVSFLKQSGVQSGDGISMLAGNTSDTVICMMAFWMMGLRYTPLHPLASADLQSYVLQHAQISHLIVSTAPNFLARAEVLARQTETIRCVFTLGEAGTLGRDLVAGRDGCELEALRGDAVDPESIAVVAYTGGTTGLPKGVMLSARACMTGVLSALLEWEWPEQVRMLIAAPLSHAAGMMILPTLIRGGSLVLRPNFHPVDFLASIERERITITFGVPTMIYALLDTPELSHADLSSLQTFIYGASSISPTRLEEALERIGPVFVQLYGQTEAPNSISVLQKSEHRRGDPVRLASCGTAVTLTRVAVLTEDGKRAATGEVGEICVAGPVVMSGYWRDPEQTAHALRDGWLHTGDLGRVDGEGFITIVDRAKDMVITGGFNVYPREVEDVLGAFPGVATSAVIGLPDSRWAEALHALVVPTPGSALSQDSLSCHVRDRLGPVYVPKSIEFVSSLPLTQLGKPDKKAIKAALAANSRFGS